MSDTGIYGDATYGSFTYGSFPSAPPGPPGTPFILDLLLEFAEEPLSDTTPTWHDISQDLIEIEWWAGKSNELGDPEPGGMRALLVNRGRRYEPEYEQGIYYPNIDTERRLRLTLTDAYGAEQQGLWYTESWELDYPTGETFSTVTVTAVDGFGLLTNDTLPHLDPPDATDFASVVDFDQPGFSYPLGEDAGTKAAARFRKFKLSIGGGRGPTVTRRERAGTKYRTRSEAEGQAGPSGTYVNNPLLGEPGAILGDPATSVLFNAPQQQWARIPLDEENTISRNRLSLEVLVKCRNPNLSGGLIGGPKGNGVANGAFNLYHDGTSGFFLGTLIFGDGTAAVVAANSIDTDWNHLVFTYDGTFMLLYLNGVLADTENVAGKTLRASDPDGFLRIGHAINIGYFDGWLQWANVYEKVLSPARILAHYQAARERGYAQQLSGDRIEEIVDSPLWSPALVTTGNFELQPMMMYGQGKLDAILEATSAERPRSFFFFNGDGDPVYRGFRAGDGTGVAVTFGDIQSETCYSAIAPIYDNEVFNTVVGSVDGGELQEATDEASRLVRKPRVRDAETSMPLAHADDVEAVITHIATEYANPTQRFASVTIHGADIGRLSHCIRRSIGDMARVKRRGEGGVPIDRQVTILGYRKHLDAKSRLLSCQYDLARGFNVTTSDWRLGASGFSELGETTVLG